MSKIRKTVWPLLALSLAIAACGKPETPKSGHEGERKSAARAKPKPQPKPVAAPAEAPDPATPTARFDMTQDGKAMTAGEFEEWMKSQDIRVADGKTATPAAAAPTEAKAAAPAQK